MNSVVHHRGDTETEIQFSKAALNHFISYLDKNSEYKGVRLSVKTTGCSGFSYVVDFVASAVEGDRIISLPERYFVCIAQKSYPFLKNIMVDYIKQGLNYELVFNNPNQTGQCGCGKSFTVG